MDHPHPHLGSGMTFAAAAMAFLGGLSMDIPETGVARAAAPPAARAAAVTVSFDDVKWGISLAASSVFGAIGIYQHVIERIEKGRYKRQAMEVRARLDREDMEADARRVREQKDAEMRLAVERLAAEIRHGRPEPAAGGADAATPKV